MNKQITSFGDINKSKRDFLTSLFLFNIATYKTENNPQKRLTPDQVLSICAAAFQENEAAIKGKIKPRLRSIQYVFLVLGEYYAPTCRLKDFVCSNGRTLAAARQYVMDTLKRQSGVIYERLLEILWKCEIQSQLDEEITIRQKQGKDDWSKAGEEWRLTTYQRSKITIKDKTWFENALDSSVFMYSQDGKEHKEITSGVNKQIDLLLKYQQQGYRFYLAKDHRELKTRNPLCDRCLNRSGCQFRGSTLLLGGFGSTWNCYKDVGSHEGVDPRLLTMPYYVAQ